MSTEPQAVDAQPTDATPGPWEYNEDFSEVQYRDGGEDVILAKLIPTERHDGGDLDERETHANGRLMAAAPDLLDAARLAADYLVGHADPTTSAAEVIEALDAAMDKAEGDQTAAVP